MSKSRKIMVRIRNKNDESKFSKKIGTDISMAKKVLWKKEVYELFGVEKICASVVSKRTNTKKIL